ncbi:hypothetical protein CLV40_10829 [Actinokineospora auranticolor]|uniref:Uncharacterized protein n=1 Tax=Actinokineospora auranticolor TaxID=155976 RepID=A0A2S6GP59_9PSEU|nr:hypothetical protein CLV40_10829 [Actinokineospora auranticolor]
MSWARFRAHDTIACLTKRGSRQPPDPIGKFSAVAMATVPAP